MDFHSLASKLAAVVRKNRQTVGIAAAAVVLILVGTLLRVSPSESPDSPADRKGVEDFLRALHIVGTGEEEPEAAAPQAEAPAAAAPSAAVLTYEQAIDLYVGRRFQFVNCRGNPGSMVVTKGTKFLLDNRDPAAHTIVVGKASYRVPGLGFAVATASTVGLLNITCDGGGSASINVTP
jgi:hypothetical protein